MVKLFFVCLSITELNQSTWILVTIKFIISFNLYFGRFLFDFKYEFRNRFSVLVHLIKINFQIQHFGPLPSIRF